VDITRVMPEKKSQTSVNYSLQKVKVKTDELSPSDAALMVHKDNERWSTFFFLGGGGGFNLAFFKYSNQHHNTTKATATTTERWKREIQCKTVRKCTLSNQVMWYYIYMIQKAFPELMK